MIDSFYENKNLLIAGSTGFIGRVLLEKLLFSLPQIRKIYILIRPRSGSSIEERFQRDILESPCFSRLREHNWEDLKKKICPVGWDISKNSLILSQTDEKNILDSVHIVINAVATSDNSLRLDQMLQVNTLVVLRLLALARKAANVHAFIHLSSAYVNFDKPEGWIQEKIYPSTENAQKVLEGILRMSGEEIEKKTSEILGKLYIKAIFTKNLTELLLKEEAKTFPICIIRPTIVGAALNEPCPGWIDTINGVSIFYLSVGLGLNKIAVGKLNKTTDQIPVDLVANTVICAAALYCKPNSPLIVHVGSSSRNPVTWQTCKKVVTATWLKFPPEKAVSGPNVQLTGSIPAYQTYVTVTKRIPLFFTYTIGKVFGNQAMVKDSLRTVQALKRDALLIKALSPFALTEWIFSTQNVQELLKMMTPDEVSRFELDPAVIDWKIYLANFIYGIKKFVLKEPIANSLKAESMDLNWDIFGAKRFADVSWALTKGASIHTRGQSEMRSLILNSPRVQQKIMELSNKDPNKPHQEASRELINSAKEYLNLIISDLKMPVVRVMAWIFKKVWRSIYEKVIIDENSLNRLSKYLSQVKGPVVIVPSHRSYVDFLIISYVLFAYKIKVPYIASSDKFLRVAILSKILRMSGAFFIKHKGNPNELFLSVLSEYITQLLKDNQLVEFYIEGLRSRSGKIQHPKFEMLTTCINAYYDGEVSDISFIPITINYDRVIESETFPLELLGENIEQESLMRLIKGMKILNQNFGRIHISISEPLVLSEFSKISQTTKEKTIQKLGYEIIFRLQESSVIMPTAIVATILLMSRKMIGEDELITKVEWARDEILARGYKVSGVDKNGPQIAVKNAISLLGNYIVSRKDLFNPRVSMSTDEKNILLLAYYRNSIQHVFVVESLIACTLYSFGETLAWEEGAQLDRVIEETGFIANLLKFEFVTRGDITDVKEINAVLEFWKKRGVIEEVENKVKVCKSAGMLIIFLCSLVWPVIDTYWATLVFCSALRKKQHIQFEKLLQSVQWFAENMCEERTLSFYESCSMHSIRQSLHSYEKMNILDVDKKNEREVLLSEKYIENNLLEELLDHISNFRKTSMVRKVGAHRDLRRALLAEFPKL